MSATLRDIATACVVDVSTVSRALRGDVRVKAATRTRVATVAAELGYRPNLAARHLVTGRTNTVWMLMGSLSGLQDHRPAQAASRHCQAHGFDLHVVSHHGAAAAFERQVGRLRQHLADGAIVIASGLSDEGVLLGSLARDGFPLVFLDRWVPEIPALAFTSDNRTAVRELLARCRQAGATHVWSLFGEHNAVERDRRKGCLSGLRAHGFHAWQPQDDALPPGAILAVIGSTGTVVQDRIRSCWSRLQGHRLCAACFDIWSGEPAPAEVVFVAEQDFATMGQAAGAAMLDLVAGRRSNRRLVRSLPIIAIHEQRPLAD